ncbi:restriction endonuclease [Saccharospirillum sp.]|uniref:restriction endonuclease n=1 Tax=Saccharospirillum sp. TaxID=2033801 RepID=UPI00349FE1EE
MTIVEAIKEVLRRYPNGLEFEKIYDEIVKTKLYEFGAIDPKQVVRSKLRQHCVGLDFPSASPTKHFYSDGEKGKAAKYFIWDGKAQPIKKSDVERPDRLPEEIIDSKHKEHLSQIKNQMMDFIYKADYGFFEKLVIKLLQKMGYGWDSKKSGLHTGGPNDKGIDGVIYLDQLGLDKVYIQAKRYKVDSAISQSDIQKFIGAMNTQGASKGVFITSSSFTRLAIEEASRAQLMKVILIDAEKLSELLIKNHLGVSVSQAYEMYTIDSDAFIDR